MSGEIVPDVDGTQTPSNCRSITMAGIRPFDLLDLRASLNAEAITVDLIGGDYHTQQYLASEKGHRHVTQLNPSPASLKPVIDKIKDPSVLMLRGCELLIRADFPFQKFKTLTALEISNCPNLNAVPEFAISQMTQLQTLNLSHLPIKQLSQEFFSGLSSLHSLILRGCSRLESIPSSIIHLSSLQYLELSHLLIKTLPQANCYRDFEKFRYLILRGCSNLVTIKPFRIHRSTLVGIDLSHCTALLDLPGTWPVSLEWLDVSYTALRWTSETHPHYHLNISGSLSRLLYRDAKECLLKALHLRHVEVLDISGAQNVRDFNELDTCLCLVELDLSRTGIESIDCVMGMAQLRTLLLRECTGLVNLPAMRGLTSLELLDISGCGSLVDLPDDLCNLSRLKGLSLSRCRGLTQLREGVFDQMSRLEQLDLSKTNFKYLPSFENLISLQTLNLSHTSVEQQVLDLSNLTSLTELFLTPGCHGLKLVPDFHALTNTNLEIVDLDQPGGTEEIDCSGAKSHSKGGSIPNGQEFHLVSTFITNSGFDRFRYGFPKLVDLISNPEKNFKPGNIQSEGFKWQFGRLRADLEYISENIDLLESSTNCSTSEELLAKLMDLSANEFPLDTTNFSRFLRIVLKLKLLVPSDAFKKKKKKKQEKEEEEEDEKDEDQDEAANILLLEVMKQLRLLKSKGFSAIKKLPDSAYKLTNLKTLNLRGSSLDELPAGIVSLKSLTHLDLTDCHLLYKLPKGVSSLSKLEVLRGFVINYQVGGQQPEKACTLRDLSKLESLRELSVVVNKDTFPDTKDLEVFMEMKNLCSLAITWEYDYNKDVVRRKALRYSCWQQLKCWEQPPSIIDTEDSLRSGVLFTNLKKLVLCCVPWEFFPDWLHPSEMQNLEELHILGGMLEAFEPDPWNNVKKLILKYLPNVYGREFFLAKVFPNKTYLEIQNCNEFKDVVSG